MFFKIGVLKEVHNIHKKTLVFESLFNKVACLEVFMPATLLKRVANTSAFLSKLQKFWEQFLEQNITSDDLVAIHNFPQSFSGKVLISC